jgi:hypothetical protein
MALVTSTIRYIATVGTQFVVTEYEGEAETEHMYLSDKIADATYTVLPPEEAVNYIMEELKIERDKIAIWQKVA